MAEEDSPRGRRQFWVFGIVGAELMLTCVAYLLYVNGGDRWGFAVIGILCGMLTHVVFLLPRERLLSMWGLTSFTVTFGAELRGLAIATSYPSKDFVDEFFLGSGTTFRGLGTAGLVTIASVALLTLGYMLVSARTRAKPVPSTSRWSLPVRGLTEPQALALAFVYAAIGLAGTLAYGRSVGGLSASVAERRAGITANGAQFQSYGQFEFLAECSTIAAVFLLCYWLSTRPRLGVARILVLVLFFANSFGLNIVTTQRSQTVDVAAAILVALILIRQRIQVPLLVVIAVATVAAIGYLTAARTSTAIEGTPNSVAYGIDSAFANRDGYDLSKTLRIISAVPEQLPYAYGETIGIVVLAPIPRAVWPSKPVVVPGPMIGRVLYDHDRSGVPPGLTAELYWNFSWPGVVIGSLLAGLALGWLGGRRRLEGSTDLVALLFYLLVVLQFGKTLAGVAVGQAITQSASIAVLLLPIALIGRYVTGRQADDADTQMSLEPDLGVTV